MKRKVLIKVDVKPFKNLVGLIGKRSSAQENSVERSVSSIVSGLVPE